MKFWLASKIHDFFSIRNIIVIIIALIIPAVIVYVYFVLYKEGASPWSIQCGFHKITGLQCPGCGGQRSVHYLLHGDIVKAFRYNAFFVIGLPFFLYMYYLLIEVHGFNNTSHLNSFFYSSRFAKIILAAFIIFFIIRNIPVEPFTYLSPS